MPQENVPTTDRTSKGVPASLLVAALLLPLAALCFSIFVEHTIAARVPAERAAYFRSRADEGDAAAQYNLGEAYLIGRGVPQDRAQAAEWFAKAAAQGHAGARAALDALRNGGDDPSSRDKAAQQP